MPHSNIEIIKSALESFVDYEYSTKANQYALDILTGVIPSCQTIRQMIDRHCKDLSTPDFEYRYDPDKAERVCKFMESLHHVKGELAGSTITLENWQCFLFTSVYGWVDSDNHRRFTQMYCQIARKNGKALSLDTMIPTPTGMKPMGDIRIGDKVYGSDGKVCNVIAETEIQYDRPCYEIVFSDQSRFVADEQHEWITEARTDITKKGGCGDRAIVTRPRTTKTTKEIAETLMYPSPKKERNHRVPIIPPIESRQKKLPIEPYLFGYWLGDGSSLTCQVTVGEQDADSFITQATKAGYPPRKLTSECSYSLAPEKRDWKNGGQKNTFGYLIRDMGVRGNKHIPVNYLKGSTSQRMALIQGLMDSDGYCSKAGQCEFTTTTPQLRDGFIELCASLGFKPQLMTARAMLNGKDCGEKYRIHFFATADNSVFRLERKTARLKAPPNKKTRTQYRQIVSCEKTKSVPVKCIQVDSPDNTYCIGRTYIPTHNSILASGIGLYGFTEGEAGADIRCGASNLKQAMMVLEPAKRMVRMNPDLAEHYGLEVMAQSVFNEESGSSFQPVVRQPADGESIFIGIADECHELESKDNLISTFQTGMVSRREPLLVLITTSGFDLNSPAYEWYELSKHVLEGSVKNDKLFTMMYGIDEDDRWEVPDHDMLLKANPNLGISVSEKFLLERQQEAITVPSRSVSFRTKHLNQWVNSASSWLPVDKLQAAIFDFDITKFKKHKAILSLDLASKSDLTALTILLPRHNDKGVLYYSVHQEFFLPDIAIKQETSGNYASWLEAGHLLEAGLNETDFGYVQERVEYYFKVLDVQAVVYDPWRATGLIQNLEKDGLVCDYVEFRNTTKNMSPAMREVEAAILSARLEISDNPVSRWCLNNTEVKEANGNIFAVKSNNKSAKIDGAVSLIMAVGYAVNQYAADDPDTEYSLVSTF